MKAQLGKLIYLIYLLSRINWIRLARALDRKASTIVWIFQDASFGTLKPYMLDNNLLNDLALIDALVQSGVRFRIKVGRRVGAFSGKRIFYTISQQFNLYGLSDHSAPMLDVVGALEKQGNLLLPTKAEASFWENKAHMHREFERLGVRSPETWVIPQISEPVLGRFANERFPLLLKEVHSAGSAGVTRVDDYPSLRREIAARVERGQAEFLVQRLLDIRRDLRVILVKEKIVLHYWRINQGKEWRPTSTGHGSNVDFVFFPERWRPWIMDSFNKLGITTGAFDVAWDGDDLESEPYILEVSPAYMPNPPLPESHRHLTYAQYKKVLFPRPRYRFDYVDVVFSIKREVASAYLRKFRQE